MKAQDILKKNTPPNILIYGPAGSGKTALVSQARRGYMLDFDNGMGTAAKLEDKFFDARNEIEFDIFLDAVPAKPDMWLRAKKKLLDISAVVAAGAFKYDAVIVDGLTGMGQCIQNQVMYQAGRPLGKPEIQHWGMMVSEMENALTILRSLNVLVMLTAHELPVLVDDTVVMKILAIGQKLPAKIPWMFDELWYAKTILAAQGKTNYIVSGRSTSSIRCRTRSNFNTDFIHQEVGLVGVLEKIGYHYNIKEQNGNTEGRHNK